MIPLIVSILLLVSGCAMAQVPPVVKRAILEDIDTVCKYYPYNPADIWRKSQEQAWERQGNSRDYIPTSNAINRFCKSKGY